MKQKDSVFPLYHTRLCKEIFWGAKPPTRLTRSHAYVTMIPAGRVLRPKRSYMQDKILEISHFSKSYSATKRAVDDLSLDVYAGDIYGFIGQNGAGKTTTLRAVTGVMDFSEGDIFICGKSVRRDPVACKSVTAYIPDNPDLYEFLTGIQ